jgi:antitoxin MazE
MRTHIVQIGNSRGIRIPKPLLEQTGLQGEVEIQVQDNTLIIRPVNKPRANWAKSFAAMAQAGDDALLDPSALSATSWDEDEWEWR